MSLTLAELAERTGGSPRLIEFVLAQEVAAGHVVRTADGGYALDVACFSPDALAGLRWLSGARPSDDDRRRAAPTEVEVADLALVAEGGS